MTSCDFSRSFITFVGHDNGNNARIQIEARCEITDPQGGPPEDYYLVASCKGEDTFGTGALFLDPSYDFCIIYSRTDFKMVRTHHNADRDGPTVGDNLDHFEDVLFHVAMRDAEELTDPGDIYDATLAARLLTGRTQIESPDGRSKAVLEFPIKTMNVRRVEYQVDTGPILVPDFDATHERMVERFDLAFVAYNGPDEAHFVIKEPTPIDLERHDGPQVSTYARTTSVRARNSVLVLAEDG